MMTRYLHPSEGAINPTFGHATVTTQEVECIDLRDALLSGQVFFHLDVPSKKYHYTDNSIGQKLVRVGDRWYRIGEVFSPSDLLSKNTSYVVVS